MNLIATACPSVAWCAAQTEPIAPTPRSRSTTYFSAIVVPLRSGGGSDDAMGGILFVREARHEPTEQENACEEHEQRNQDPTQDEQPARAERPPSAPIATHADRENASP